MFPKLPLAGRSQHDHFRKGKVYARQRAARLLVEFKLKGRQFLVKRRAVKGWE